MSLSKIAVKRPVTTTMILLIAVAFGVMSIFNLKLDMMPNMNIPIALVSTSYTGAGPEEVLNLVTKPVEGALGTVAGIKNLTSISSNGSSIVVAEFENGVNIDNAALDMRERIDMIDRIMPDDAGDPMVMKIDINNMSSQLMVGVSSQRYDLVELKSIVDDRITNRLERQEGVASVSASGGLEKEIAVTLLEDKIRGLGISEATVSQLLMAENRNNPTGDIKQGDLRLQVRAMGEFESLDDVKNLMIPTAAGSSVRLEEIADVSEVYKEITSLSYIDGRPSITLSIQKQSTANTVNVSDAVLQELKAIERDMPEITIQVLLDPAEFIRFTLGAVVDSAWQGALLAVIILYIFLRNFRTTMIVAVSIPTSIVVTFVLMYYANITLNVMSLGGLALGIGMLVDNSIVVLESIYRKIEEGEDRISAAIDGAAEVAMAVTASTLTTVAIFLPITFSGGLTAQIFNEMALTIAFSLFSSLVVSLTFVPMAASLVLRRITEGASNGKNPFTAFMDKISAALDGLRAFYEKTLRAVIRHKALTIIISFIFVGLTLATLPIIGMEFMPVADQAGVSIEVELPKGSILAETEKITDKVIKKLEGYPDVTRMSWTVGGGGGLSITGSSTSTDSASINVSLTEKSKRNKSAALIATEMAAHLSDIPGAQITAAATNQGMGAYAGGNTLDVNIKGDSLEILSLIADDLQTLFREVPGVTSVSTSVEEATPQATIKINRAKANMYGISAYSISNIINTAVSGTVATTYKIDGEEYDIRVRQSADSYQFITDIENILIPSPLGSSVPLYELSDITMESMPVSIQRENKEIYVSLSAAFVGVDSSTVANALTAIINSYPLPDDCSWDFSGSVMQMNETFSSLGLTLIMGVFLVYMIMAAQFESLIYPFIVMFSIPIAITGGVFGLFVFRQTLSITSFLGLIMLVGIVVNNGIVLIDYINHLTRERGMTTYDAVVTAGPIRLRPILMTTLTTVLALVPMMLTNQQGSELMRGLSVTVVFGLSLSTLITLILVPVVYVVVNDIKNRFTRT